MLDQLRRHAKSWVVKGVLALIVLTFIFFFGYSQISSRDQDQQNFIARVGKIGISRRKVESTYQSSLERMKEGFKGEIPENIEKFLRQNVVEQMIARELMVQLAGELGLTISDQEIADAIRSDKGLSPDGNFDVVSYRERFLPAYRHQTGEDFETMMARSLLVEKVQALLPILFEPWEPGGFSRLTPDQLFTPWLEQYREKVKVEVFDRQP